jgi:hypothetical protein
MASDSVQPQRSVGRAILLGTLAVGILDAADALIFFGLRGARPIRIFQSIAAGLLGRASFSGGIPTALLGGLLHFFIAFLIVTTCVVASRWIPLLRTRPIVSGVIYGIGAYLVMNLIVLPLSAAGRPGFVPVVVLNGLLIHMFGVGVPSCLAARAAYGRSG